MRGKSYFKNVLSEAEDMYSNASGRRSAFRGQAGGGLLGGGGGIGGLMCYFQSDFGAYGDFEPPFSPYSGCTDSRADNFNPDACYEDMSCSFSGPYAEVYSQEYLMSASQCQFVCSTTSGGSTTGGGIVDSAFGTGKDPKGKGRIKRKGMRSASGGGKTKVATAVNWLTSLI